MKNMCLVQPQSTIFLHPPRFTSQRSLIIKCKKTRKQRDQQNQRQRRNLENNTPSLPYPKPSPTPLLNTQKTPPQTKIEALTSIVNDVEAAMNNGIGVDVSVLTSLLETCCQIKAFDQGFRIRRFVSDTLLRKNNGLSAKLVRLYSLCGDMESAHEVFDRICRRELSVFAWNSLISGYAGAGMFEDAIAVYFQMDEEGFQGDCFTFPRVLKACGGVGDVRIGERVYRDAVSSGFGDDVYVLNALVDMYAKCGDIVKAREVFDRIGYRDSVSWNTMLTGYVRCGFLMDAVEVFRGMLDDGIEPDSIAISKILTGLSSLKLGVQVHGWVLRRGVEWNLSVANALVHLYSRHGQLDRARCLFERMPQKDTVSWNAIISASSKGQEALAYFKQMEDAGISPDCITFVLVLSSCAHLSLVRDGEQLFSVMRDKYGIKPSNEHYACMVNLYGRAGLIDNAYEIIVKQMEFEAGPTVWGALLYACSLHCNVVIGEIAAERLFELEPDNEHNFELLMKIYGNAGKTEDMQRVRNMMMERGLEYYRGAW